LDGIEKTNKKVCTGQFVECYTRQRGGLPSVRAIALGKEPIPGQRYSFFPECGGVTPPLIPHNGCYQIPFPLNLCNTRNEIKRENIAKSGSISLERSITRGEHRVHT
jgi:hypothetical protein